MTIPLDAALHMSYTVSAATDAAVIASISTPVPAVHEALAVMCSECAAASSSKSTDACDIGTGWQSGMRSAVRLAASTPATRATASTSPLALSDSASNAVGPSCTVAPATASRLVVAFPDTSTIEAAPAASMWLRTLPLAVLAPAAEAQPTDDDIPTTSWRAEAGGLRDRHRMTTRSIEDDELVGGSSRTSTVGTRMLGKLRTTPMSAATIPTPTAPHRQQLATRFIDSAERRAQGTRFVSAGRRAFTALL
eukprot:CAMPEP_0185424752 /NCGR_PEP_ID=MMETSP1365-20130426/13453_1 /TAXON_ID=38817 /ORGANISM="Gephyrocapsa oceanica, Strain RCC1303" /LENGTH=250 /DNA_ID=CAMNT_0028028703 /DNA_START=251 /DNA_END=1003 /DNA_ORIENTATION=-